MIAEERDISYKLKEFENRNICLWVEDDKLKYRVAAGGLSQEDMIFLKANKERIIEMLQMEGNRYGVDEANRYEPFPLTDVQQAYILGRSEAFDYGGTACHIYMQFAYDELEVARVEEIWNLLIEQHDMLRVQISPEGYQKVRRQVPRFEVKRFEEAADPIVEEMRHRVYDTTQWPLFDVAVQKGKEKDILHFSIEFLIADWTSIWMLLTKFEAMYFENDYAMPKIPVQFRDYVIAERRERASYQYQKDREYWLSRVENFKEAPKLPVLPYDKKHKARFERFNLSLSPDKWNRIKERSAQYGVTPTAVVMAVYANVLGLYSQTKEFVLNLTVLNRSPLFEQVEHIIGDFTSVNLLEVQTARGNFVTQAKEIGNRLFEDLDHRTFSGVEMMREITRIKGKNAAFMPYVFTSAIGLLQSIERGSLRGFMNEGGISQTPQVFIDCQVMDGAFGFQANWDVRKHVFKPEVIESMFALFAEGMEYLAKEESWEDFIVKRPASQQKIIDKANATGKNFTPYLLHAPIVEIAKRFPDKKAIIQGDSSMSYRELLENANGIYKRLLAWGCKKQDKILIAMEKCAYQVSAALAILAMGGVYVPIQNECPPNRFSDIAEQTGASCLITTSTSVIPRTELPLVYAERCISEEATLPVEGNPENLAYIIFTSGSTGIPKGVMITHAGAGNTIEDVNERIGLTENDIAFGLSELHFDLSVYDIFGVLGKGGTLVYPQGARKTDPSYLAKIANKEKITFWNSVPAYMQMMMEYAQTDPELKFPYLRNLLMSGDFIPIDLPDHCLEKMNHVTIYSLGGATEGSIWSNIYKYTGRKPEDVTILYGKPLANQEYRIFDILHQEVPMWVEGELYIVGDGVALGYLGDEEKTREHFSIDPITGKPMYRTGDYGRYQSDGNIEFIGRKDEQIKIRGHRIELGEIEKAILSQEGVEQAYVIVDDKNKDKRLIGFLKLEAEQGKRQEKRLEEIQRALGDNLPQYMIPGRLQIIQEIPLTANGKVDKKALKSLISYGEDLDKRSENGDMSEKEQQLRELLKKSGLEVNGREDNFYEYGADSLIMARAAGKIREHMAPEITFDTLLRQLLNFPTIAELSSFLGLDETAGNQKMEEGADTKTSEENTNGVFTMYGGGEGRLRVVFHAALGTMNCFRFLIPELVKQNKGQVVGISVKDIQKFIDTPPEHLMESLADDYAAQILKMGYDRVQLIGYCSAGWVALEVGNRLVEQGIEVETLKIIDSQIFSVNIDNQLVQELTYLPNIYVAPEQVGFASDKFADAAIYLMENYGVIGEKAKEQLLQDSRFKEISEPYDRLSSMTCEERFELYAQLSEQNTGVHLDPKMTLGMFTAYQQTFKSIDYEEHAYIGDVQYIKAREEAILFYDKEKTLSYWENLCLGDFSVCESGGNHYTCVEEPENAKAIACIIEEGLDE